MKRLLIVAPSTAVRAGLQALVASAPDLQVVGSAPDLTEVEDYRPDVVLASLPMEDVSSPGAETGGAIVLLSNEPEPTWGLEAYRRGVRAILSRDASPAEVLAAVEAVANDLAVIEPGALGELLAATAPAPAPQNGQAVLTARELEVLRMMADGAANKMIAWKLGVSDHTVKFHVASILAKLDASSRTEAVTIGIRRGLVLL